MSILSSLFKRNHDDGEADDPGSRPAITRADAERICQEMVSTLREQRKNAVEGGFYWETQIAFAYNSNKIEGSGLTYDQTRTLFETGTIGGEVAKVDDIIEMRNHFYMFDYMLDTLDEPLSANLIQRFQAILKTGTSEVAVNDNAIAGGWKITPNAVGDKMTTPPEFVEDSIGRLLAAYLGTTREIGYREIAGFHAMYESIHPFFDGNGRTGRMIAYRECLTHNLVPFIVPDDKKGRYYEGLRSFDTQPTLLENYFADMGAYYYECYSGLLPSGTLPGFQKEEHIEKLEATLGEYFGESKSVENADKATVPGKSPGNFGTPSLDKDADKGKRSADDQRGAGFAHDRTRKPPKRD